MKWQFSRIKYYDIIALLFGIIVFSFFFIRVRYGINRVDESFYLAVAQRFIKGDRPLVDEWQISQLSDLFLIPFYCLYKAFTGGIDGIILFMRRVFVVVDFVFFWIAYLKLRNYRLWGFFSAAVLAAYVPWAMFALNYYTMAPRLLTIICLLLFFGKTELSAAKLIVSGVLLSAAVLIEPPLVLLYFFYCLLVLIVALRRRNKGLESKYSFILNPKSWLYITAAVCVCAVLFIAFLSWKSGLKNVLASLPELLRDSEYDFSPSGNVKTFLISKVFIAAHTYGVVNLCLSVLVCMIAMLYDKNAKNERGKLILFSFSNLLLLSMCVYSFFCGLINDTRGWHDWYYYVMTPLPLYAFGFVNYRLCAHKSHKLYVVWAISLISSLIMDSFSDVSFSVCGAMAAIPGFICFGELLKEFREYTDFSGTRSYKVKRNGQSGTRDYRSRRNKKTDRAFIRLSVAALTVFIAWECANIYFEGTFLLYENQSGHEDVRLETIDAGSYKGILTSSADKNAYDELLEDLALIRSESDGPVYIDNIHPIAALNLDLPLANCSSWYSTRTRDRQLRYFITHPDKAPDIIYYCSPKLFGAEANERQLEFFHEFAGLLCEGTATQGKAGIIIKVQRWKDPNNPAILKLISDYQGDFNRTT